MQHQVVSSLGCVGGVDAELAYAFLDGDEDAVERHHCFIANGRGLGHELERDGFELTEMRFPRSPHMDVYDMVQCSSDRYPLVAEVLRKDSEEVGERSSSFGSVVPTRRWGSLLPGITLGSVGH